MPFRLYLNNSLFYSFDADENANNKIVTSLKLKKEINTLSELTFTVFMNHPLFDSIRVKRSCFILTNNSTSCLFIGKVRSIRRNLIQQTAEIDCEELLGCLRDSVITPTNQDNNYFKIGLFKEDTFEAIEVTYSDLLDAIIFAYNADSSSYNILNRRPVGMFGKNISISIPESPLIDKHVDYSKLDATFDENCVFNDYLSMLYDHLLGHTLAVITTSTVVNATASNVSVTSHTINYRTDIRDNARDPNTGVLLNYNGDYLKNSDFTYGVNIIDIEEEASNEEIASVIIPYGTLEITSGNNSGTYNIYMQSGDRQGAYVYVPNIDTNMSENLINRYGYIAKPVDFEKIAKYETKQSSLKKERGGAAEILKEKAEDWAQKILINFANKYTVTGIDKYFINGSSRFGRPIDIGDIVYININKLLGIDDTDLLGPAEGNIYDYCLSLEIDFFNHENDRYIIGPYVPDGTLEYKASEEIKVDKKKNAKNKKRGGLYLTSLQYKS